MINSDRKLVVMTPIRNEAWILPRFLEVTGRVADVILILDQNSTDGSVELCKAHPKVVFLENRSSKYDEAERQKILIENARKTVPGARVLLALDADEIISADSPASEDWRSGMNAPPGTVLQIEKPTFYESMDRVIRYPGGFPLGMVDDDSPHNPRLIHSVRIPMRDDSPVLKMDQVKALHYALMRPRAQAAKARMYCAIENIAGTRHLLARRQLYGSKKDYSKEGPIQSTPLQWFSGWEDQGIDMRTIQDDPPHWQDFELLRLFAKHGCRKFWFDDLWNQDWESFRQEAIHRGMDAMPGQPISSPPRFLRWLMQGPDLGYSLVRKIRSRKTVPENKKQPASRSTEKEAANFAVQS